ncbi:MAG TPA: hypothetical protein VGF07_04060 [Stellaceae bacterium]|jgi:hypothetical protein
MKAWPIHLVFATVLIGSLAAKERAADALIEVAPDRVVKAAALVAQSHGLTLDQRETLGGNVPALRFAVPGCAEPVLVLPRITFDFDPALQAARDRGDALRYVYIGQSWDRPARLAAFAERMKYAALATFALTRYVPSAYVLLVDARPECRSAEAIDWRDVWNRDYLGKITSD